MVYCRKMARCGRLGSGPGGASAQGAPPGRISSAGGGGRAADAQENNGSADVCRAGGVAVGLRGDHGAGRAGADVPPADDGGPAGDLHADVRRGKRRDADLPEKRRLPLRDHLARPQRRRRRGGGRLLRQRRRGRHTPAVHDEGRRRRLVLARAVHLGGDAGGPRVLRRSDRGRYGGGRRRLGRPADRDGQRFGLQHRVRQRAGALDERRDLQRNAADRFRRRQRAGAVRAEHGADGYRRGDRDGAARAAVPVRRRAAVRGVDRAARLGGDALFRRAVHADQHRAQRRRARRRQGGRAHGDAGRRLPWRS